MCIFPEMEKQQAGEKDYAGLADDVRRQKQTRSKKLTNRSRTTASYPEDLANCVSAQRK